MGHFKTFLFGLFTAYSIYYITKKGEDGRSILDELLANPSGFMHEAKDQAMRDTVRLIKDELS